jgi:hypothetical protein
VALGNMALGFINLLPIPSSDGLRILKTLRNPNNPGPEPSAAIVPKLSESHPN